jgi:hypothetical protein
MGAGHYHHGLGWNSLLHNLDDDAQVHHEAPTDQGHL